jgi:ABC-type sugar transport system ATPase subunit
MSTTCDMFYAYEEKYMLLTVRNLTKAYGAITVLSDVSFTIPSLRVFRIVVDMQLAIR